MLEAMEGRRLLSGVSIGMNLDGFADDSTNGAFTDLARLFRPWGRPATPYQPDATIPVTNPSDPWPDNYPLVDASAMTYATAYPDGDYQVSYQGTGTVEFKTFNGQLLQPTFVTVGDHKEAVVHLQHDAGGGGIFEIHLKNINVADPVRNIHIMSPDANPAISPTFRPVFLDKLKYWNGPLRFMDWEQTNDNTLVNWSDRTQTDRFSFCTANGVPLETIIELANLTRKDVWINTPLHASDDYIKRMADMIRDQLNPTLRVFVENSNELWNIGFQQSKDILFESRADADPFILGTDDVGRMAQLAGRKMVHVTNLFRQEFGASRFDGQVRPVFGSFVASTYWAQKALDYINRRYGPPRDYLYGLAIAPYVGVQGDINSVDNETLTLDSLFAAMNSFIDTNITQWIQQHKALCDQFGLKLESYEAGQSLQGQNGKNVALKEAAQDDPRMGLMYQHLINVWAANGGDVFGNFSLANHYSINGYWGLLDRIDRTTSVKFEAVKAMLPLGGPPVGAQVSISSGLVGNRGDVVHAYISIDDAAGLSSFDLKLNYNTALLDLADMDVTLTGPLGASWTLVPNVDDATGKVTLVGFTTTPQTAGGGRILDLAFHVRAGAAAGTAVLDIDDTGSPSKSRLNEGQMPANFADGSITVPVGTSITGAPPTNPEGTPINLAAGLVGASGSVTYLWHVVASNGQVVADSTAAALAFTPVDDGTYTVTLNVTDQNGISGSAVRVIGVTNVAPAASITGAPPTSPEGTGVTLGSTVSDPSSTDTFTYAWSVTKNGVAYGAGGAGTSFTFTPNDNGMYVVTLTVTDDNGGVGTDSKTVTVTNVNPVATITGAPANSPEGTTISLTGSSTDAGSADVRTYAWTVTKDGAEFASGAGTGFSFTPDDNGAYVVTLRATDDDGGVGTDVKAIAVTNVNPAAAISGGPAGSSPEGTAINLTGSFTDAGAADTHTLTWAVTRNGVAFGGGGGASFGFTPDDEGAYVVTLTVTDDDGGVGTAVRAFTVTNANPVATITNAPATSPEGTAISLTGAATDAGAADTLTSAWTVTRGANLYASGSGTALTFTPDDNGAYVVTWTVTDNDGGVGSDSKTINVTNVNPVATITGAPAASVAEGTSVTLGASVTDAGTADTFSYAWTVTKNGVVYGAGGAGASFTFTPDDNGAYVVSLTVTDKDGGVGGDSKTILVTNVAPTAAIGGVPAASSPELTAIPLVAVVTDASSADTFTYAWTVVLAGQTVASGSGATLDFTPAAPGSYVVSLTVTDDDGASATAAAATIVVTPVTFRVASVTPTAWGFDLAFNRGANFAPINLYRTAGGTRGLADVVFSGLLQGPVAGSLVYDAARDVYSFVKTGAPLLPDDYTVFLRSSAGGADGWADVRGGALDGDADGTAGGDYTSAFTLGTPPERVVSLPDFARGPNQSVNVPNAATGLPIRINDGTGLTAVVLTLTYDPQLLNVTGVSGPAGWTTSMVQDAPGRITITAGGAALAGGAGDLFHLTAAVPAGAAYGASDLIRITQLSLNGGAIGGHADAAIHEVVYFGDATASRDYSGMDAVGIARVAAELDEGFELFPRVDPRIVGDVTGDGTLSGLDASYVARASVGLSTPQIPALPATPGLPVGAPPLDGGEPAAEIRLSVPDGLVARAGQTIHLPVNVSAFADVQSFDLVVTYDTTLLDLSNADVSLGQSVQGWMLVQNVNDSQGTLRLTMYRLDPASGGPGSVLDLAFHIPLTAASGAAPLSVAGRADEGTVPMSGGPGVLQIDATPPKVLGASFDPNGGPHRLIVRFGEDVSASLGTEDITVTDVATGATIDRSKLAIAYDARTNTAVITFPGLTNGILPDGDYRLTVTGAGVSDAAGNALDGAATGAAGSDFELSFYQMLGDLNRDHVVDGADRAILTGAMGGTVITARDGDANNDHQVNFSDLVAVAQHYDGPARGAAEGDFDGDGVVGFADLVAVAQHYDRDGRGDLNGDGLIDQADLDRLDAILNPPAAPAAVAAAMPVAAPSAVAAVMPATATATATNVFVAKSTSKTKKPAKASVKTLKAPVKASAVSTVSAPPSPFGKSRRIKRAWAERD